MSAALTPLQRKLTAPAPMLELWPDLRLTLGRVHEACGPNRRSFAMMIAQKTQGPVFWIAPQWATDRLHADGVHPFICPGRLTFLTPKRAEDILWCVEEVLRSGAVPLVVVDIPRLPALTPIRRLNLAAETGTAEGASPPLGLLLTPGDGGAPGVESRWRLAAAVHQGLGEQWHLERIRSRSDPPRNWRVSRQNGRYTLGPLSKTDDTL